MQEKRSKRIVLIVAHEQFEQIADQQIAVQIVARSEVQNGQRQREGGGVFEHVLEHHDQPDGENGELRNVVGDVYTSTDLGRIAEVDELAELRALHSIDFDYLRALRHRQRYDTAQ